MNVLILSHFYFIFILVLCYLYFAMKLELVTKKDVTYVELQKEKKHSFGVSIRDGTQDEGGPVIKKVEQKGPAAKSFAVSKDDVILSVNGYSTAGARCKDVRRMLKNAGANVDLQLLYKTRETSILECSAHKKQQIAIRLRKVNGSFGFLLRKKTSKYSFSMQYPVVTNIKEGSPAYKGGQLQEGDRLLMIDGVSLSWMSLSYIASLLQEKEEAEFTFEYSVGVFNFVEEGAKLELEIDVPIADLGIDIRACDEERTVMYIGNIRLGGIAERCGIFSEGDVILSINDIETKDLTFPKAYFLLRNAKKSRKISFISNRPKEKIAKTPQENACTSTDDNDDDDMVTTESYTSSSRTVDWKHLNTPASSNFAFSEQQKYNFQSFCYREQVKTVDKFQSIFAILSSLKQNLSTLTREAFRGTQNMLSRNCTSCNRAQHTVKLCTSCLARLNVKCAQSMDVLRNLVAHFVRFSTNGVYEREKRQFGVSVIDVTRMLSETLPDVLGVPELKECFAALAKKITSADATCSTCDFEVKSVMMVVQQLLLVLTVTDNSEEFEDLIEHLVSCLLSVKFTCDGETESVRSTAGECVSSSENVSESVLISIEEEGSSRSGSSRIRNNSETESNAIEISIESNLNFPQVKASVNREYLKLTHIKSLSESRNSVSGNPDCESNALGASLVGSRSKLLEENATKTSMTSVASETATTTRVKRLIKSMKLPKVWRSLDSLIRPRRPSRVPSTTQNACRPTRDQCKSNDPSTVKSKAHSASTRNVKSRLSPSYTAGQKGRKVSDSNGESTPSFSKPPRDDSNSTKPSKTQPETMKVTLKNEGNGFGLDISLVAGSRIPVISDIHPKGPALKIGVLKVGDRILAINQRNTSRISPKQLMSLKKKAFSADNITLAVEFDIDDEIYRFGTFDVVLKRTLKTGLIFEDMKKDSPMIVSGIAKGSAAHRCGQLFPGDKIKYFRYSKNEEFNPVSSRYIREEYAIITVHRDPRDVIEAAKRRANQTPCYVNPCFHPEDSSKTRLSFVVKKTAVRSMENRDALVLDHEVTLFRDPKSFDFGILLGEDPATGRAYVKDIRPDGPAHKSGVIKKYDRIVEVNGVLVNRNVSNSVLELLSRANQQVDLLIRRIYKEELSES